MRLFLVKIYLFIKYRKQGVTTNPFSLLNELEESQYWDRNKIESFQLNHLNELFSYSKKNVKYYQQDKYKDISSVSSFESFNKNFPALYKENIKDNSSILMSDNVGKRIKHATSGSTGKPMTIEISGLAEAYRIASRLRFFRWWKVDFYDRNVLIWRKPKPKSQIFSLLETIKVKLLGKLKLDVFELNKHTVFDYFNKIEKFKPLYIRGYKSGIYELARLMDINNLQFKKTRLKVVVVTSEILLEKERDFMKKVFNCKIANEYGAADGGQFSFECPDGSMHINEELVYISSDENNNAHVTELFNNGMPLINFKNEDRVTLSNEQCSCGRNLMIISKIEGRTTDYIACKDGTKKHSLVFVGIFNAIENEYQESINQFRAIQKGNKLKFEIIAGKNYSDKVENLLELLIRQEICNNIDIEIQLVDQIQREKNGKLRYFIKKG